MFNLICKHSCNKSLVFVMNYFCLFSFVLHVEFGSGDGRKKNANDKIWQNEHEQQQL